MYRHFKKIGNTVHISSGKSKELFDESIKPRATSNNSLAPALNYVGNNSLFGVIKLIENANINEYRYSGYCIGFDRRGTFSVPGGFGRNVLFGADMSSSAHVDNKQKHILILGKGPTQVLDDTT